VREKGERGRGVEEEREKLRTRASVCTSAREEEIARGRWGEPLTVTSSEKEHLTDNQTSILANFEKQWRLYA